MALPTGIFSNAAAGRLQVSFSGKFASSKGDFGPGALDIAVRAYVGSGADRQTAVLSLNASQSAFIERAYPGGNVPLPVGFEYVGHSFSGPSAVEFSKCLITCVLIKR